MSEYLRGAGFGGIREALVRARKATVTSEYLRSAPTSPAIVERQVKEYLPPVVQKKVIPTSKQPILSGILTKKVTNVIAAVVPKVARVAPIGLLRPVKAITPMRTPPPLPTQPGGFGGLRAVARQAVSVGTRARKPVPAGRQNKTSPRRSPRPIVSQPAAMAAPTPTEVSGTMSLSKIARVLKPSATSRVVRNQVINLVPRRPCHEL